jgi:tRNA-Thr(GGU) m(6)t(6)A37 methyltransferase TsaA
LRSPFTNKFGTPRQGALVPSSQAEILLAPEWRGRGIFQGLEGFSHVWLISYFHQNKNIRISAKIHPPRLEGEKIGVLASRSPHRPNPIGLTLAKIESFLEDRLILSGIDLVDGTPILDIKPYLAEADRPETFRTGWPSSLATSDKLVEFTEQALEQIQHLHLSGEIPDIEMFISVSKEVFQLDPRPLAYRSRADECFHVVIGALDVHARFFNDCFSVIAVTRFDPATKGPRNLPPERKTPPPERD